MSDPIFHTSAHVRCHGGVEQSRLGSIVCKGLTRIPVHKWQTVFETEHARSRAEVYFVRGVKERQQAISLKFRPFSIVHATLGRDQRSYITQ